MEAVTATGLVALATRVLLTDRNPAVAHIAIVNPRFEVSYWGLEHALGLFGKRANLPVACLALLAALTPRKHQVTIVDENVEPLDLDELAKADIVGVTGMSVQRFRMREIIEQLKARGAFVVVGGPWVTVQEDYFDGLADAIFIGEAEQTWPQFLEDWEHGTHAYRYEQSTPTDMTSVPPPRLDLLKLKRYVFGSLQISRGCPFQCEFCDIIVTFGRRPRLKTSQQVIAELDAWRRSGTRLVFIVDDNLIGNKQEIKKRLHDVIRWQREHGYPLTFFTEASLDLADDEELMRLMGEANIQTVFIGIETPNEAALQETKKYQNVREKGGSMLERIRRIQDAGIDIWCGMILGFDNDDRTIFEVQNEFLTDARIAQAMVGMLHAIPKTPLHARLQEEGRLDPEDTSEYGTNVIPLRMGRDELRDGFLNVMQELYEPQAYFDRLDSLFISGRFRYAGHHNQYWQRHRWRWNRRLLIFLAQFIVLYGRLMRRVDNVSLRAEYRRRIWGMFKARQDPSLLLPYAMKCISHYHVQTMTADMMGENGQIVNSF